MQLQHNSASKVLHLLFAGFIALALPGSSRADWNVTILHPAGALESVAYGAGGTQQVGMVRSEDFGPQHAVLWNGSAASAVDLSPAGSSQSWAFGTSGSQQVGFATNLTQHAALWNGTAASHVDLHPAGSTFSAAIATNGTTQVGVAHGFTAIPTVRASMWSGTADSWVDLSPAGSSESYANAVSGNMQGGYTLFFPFINAGIWQGTSESWTNLHPNAGPGIDNSAIYGMAGSQQVGVTSGFANFTARAALWTGTAESYVDLAPAGAIESVANATDGTHQVGYARFGVNESGRAVLWNGTAASWEDLSLWLPANSFASYATGVWSDGPNIYVSGYYQETISSQNQAVLWTQPVPEPGMMAGLALALIGLMRRRG